MKSTRQRLLELLKNRNNQTAAELSRALGVTQADARYHLSKMVNEGLIVVVGQQRAGRRGRPARRYALAEAALKDNFDLLSSALLTITLADLSQEEQKSFLCRVAAALVGETDLQGPLSQRLVRAIEKLNELGYVSRWEAHATAPRLILENCPFANLLNQHPQLCQLDACMLEILLDEPVVQIESQTDNPSNHCIYIIRGG
jgi:predicted ArsR family transcriptional regulator